MGKGGWLVIRLTHVSPSGMPDLIAHKDGKTVYIEVKRPGKKPEPLQEYQHRQLHRAGIQVYVLDSVEQAKNFVNND